MRHILQITFILFALTLSFQVNGQNLLSKANKQYELHAYTFAVANYLKVLQKEPNEPQALARLADSYRMLNRMKEAETYFAKAVEVAGIDPDHFLHYGKVLMALGKYEDAKIWFKTYSESDAAIGEHFIESCDYAISLKGKAASYRVYKEYMNTNYSDFGPAFFGDYVVYSSSRTDIKRQLKKNTSKGFSESPNNQLYITSMDNKGYLRTPTLLQSDLQNNYNEGPVAYSEDGEWVVFTKNIFENGIRQIPEAGGTLAMYIAEVDENNVWSNVKPLPFNVNGYSAGYPAFSPDGKLLYFSSNREGGFGGWDLYAAFKTATGWSVPQNLGPVINSPGDEISPSFNGKTLYFSSDYHYGLGGMDIFRAEKSDGEWNEVFHLGNSVNTSFDDYGFIFNSSDNRGYFVSNRNGTKGGEDIYKVKKMTDNFVITVMNESDLNPIEGATIDFSACGEPNYTTNVDGKYVFEALAGLGCDVIIKKKGYKDFALKINSLGERLTRSYEVKLRKIGEEFVGKIVDSQSNESVKDVLVKVTNPNNGLTFRTETNEWGEYTLALQPTEKYIIRYSKAGYLNTHKKIAISSKTDKSVLGVLSFKQSYTTEPGDGAVVFGNDDNEVIDIPDDEEIPTDFNEVVLPKGYAVQVAAYFDDREVNVGKYEKLQEVGNVYKTKEGKAEKVRVGIFSSRKEAEEAKKTITKQGYAKAFVVSEEGRKAVELRIEEENEIETEVIDLVEIPKSTYKVRVATFRSTKNFDDRQIADLGDVERRKAGKYTIVLLGGFKSQKQADLIKRQIVALGYDDAHLVIDEGKKLKRVK